MPTVQFLVSNDQVQNFLDAAEEMLLPAGVVPGGTSDPEKTALSIEYDNPKALVWFGMTYQRFIEKEDTPY